MDSPARLAVLIDAENVSSAILDRLFGEIAGIGLATVRRAYGDFTNPTLAPWNAAAREHSIVPVQHGNNTKGKNASDIGLVIDAMDLLHSGSVDAFCIASSDGDFTRLAIRIRERNVRVYGFGERKTPKSLVSACYKFIYTDILDDSARGRGKKDAAAAETRAAPIPIETLREAATAAASDDTDWAHLGQIGQIIQSRLPDFDVRDYGHKSLKSLFEASREFEVRPPESGSGAVLVRLRAQTRKAR